MEKPFPTRRQLPHEVPAWVPDGAVYAVTINCKQRGLNSLCHEELATLIRSSAEFRMSRGEWWIHLLLLMPDHLHMLVSFEIGKRMTLTVSQWKAFVAKEGHIEWQRNFFDHRLRGNESFREKASYIRANPVVKGLVEKAEEWPFVWTWPVLG
ncbi:MAG: hypothetical protein M5U15_11710 [Kiritimatiellae bacterium]|nr:hypothetical protein [Kiritimatiellia bacterium]